MALAIVVAVWELIENKNATKAKITVEYQTFGVQLMREVLGDTDFVKFAHHGMDAVPHDHRIKVLADFMAVLVWHQLGYSQWRAGYISDSFWKPIERDMCQGLNFKGPREFLSADPSSLRVVLDPKFMSLIDTCLANPSAFVEKSYKDDEE